MNVFNQQIISRCVIRHASSGKAMNRFIKMLMACEARNHAALLAIFKTADYVGNDRYVFDIKGNDFRVVCIIVFVNGAASIRFAGTHAEYDKINASTI
ncbi:MAG: type II toxin-antitoxin system HigB family toxin [Prevotellaceae bacterium]|jgi:mRNA interferase HigB|nr:type II toxin-antitoxin system HigB family toxin [Prevotellaceae bacterium]